MAIVSTASRTERAAARRRAEVPPERRREWQRTSNAKRVRKSVSMTPAQSRAVEALGAVEGTAEFSPLAKKALAVLAEKHGIEFPEKEGDA